MECSKDLLISQQKGQTGDDITPILLKKDFVTRHLFSFVSEEVRNGSFHSRSSLMKRVFKFSWAVGGVMIPFRRS